MSGVEISVEGLDELVKNLETVANAFPKETESELVKVAKEFRKDYVRKVRAEVKTQSGTPKSLTKLANVKYYKRRGEEKGTAIDIGATSPHFHLFERGHNKIVPWAPSATGFVEGRHCMEDTAKEYENKFPEIAQHVLDEVLKKGDLN